MSVSLPFYPPTNIPAHQTTTASEGTIAKIVNTAIEEWKYFGQEIKTGSKVVQQGLHETNRSASKRVGKYWKFGAGIKGRDGRTLVKGKDDKKFRPAWSAAFISYVMWKSGVTDRWFPGSQRHMGYIHFAVNNSASNDPDEQFYGHRLNEYSPKVGDLVGYSRSSWVNYKAALRQAKGESHTDIVVFTRQGMIGVIGGNVGDSVTLKMLKTDGRGRLVDKTEKWFVVIENRLPVT